MSELDDAIREHLELKRRHGARDAELKQLEDEAFGTGERPADPFSAADQLLREGDRQETPADGTSPDAPPPSPGDSEPAPEGGPPDTEAPTVQAPVPPEASAPAEAPAADPVSEEPSESSSSSPAGEETAPGPAPPPTGGSPIPPPPPPDVERASEVVSMPTEEHPPPPIEEPPAPEPPPIEEPPGEEAPAPDSPADEGGIGIYDFESEAAPGAVPPEPAAGASPPEAPPAVPPREGFDLLDEDEDAFAELGPADRAPEEDSEPAGDSEPAVDLDLDLDLDLEEGDAGPGAVTADTSEREAIEPTEQYPLPGEEPVPPAEPAAGEESAPAADPESEDLLEETPEFLEESEGEDEDLWFEQRPPKDFDFDE